MFVTWNEVSGRVEFHVRRKYEMRGGCSSGDIPCNVDRVEEFFVLPVGGDILPLGRVSTTVSLSLQQVIRRRNLRQRAN